MRKIPFIFFFFYLSPFITFAQSISVVYPNSTNISFQAGSIYPVLWESTLIDYNNDIDILLSINDGKDYFIKLATSKNDGLEFIKIPSCFSQAAKCRVKLQLQQNNNIQIESANNFVIDASNWSLNLMSSDSVEVPLGDSLANLSLKQYFSVPTTNIIPYTLVNNPSVNYLYYHNTLYPPTGCGFTWYANNSNQFTFTVENSSLLRFTNYKIDSSVNFNSTNIFAENTFDCNGFIGASYARTATSQSFASTLSTNLIAGNIYKMIIYNNFSSITNGYIKLLNSTSGNNRVLLLQNPQPVFRKTFLALDENLTVKKVDSLSSFKDLPIGKYKIIGLAYLPSFNPYLFVNQNIHSLDFNQSCILISENIKNLRIVPNCQANSSLIGNFTGILVNKVSETIQSSQKFSNSSIIEYKAGKSITLESGFYANKGTIFKAEIQNCY